MELQTEWEANEIPKHFVKYVQEVYTPSTEWNPPYVCCVMFVYNLYI